MKQDKANKDYASKKAQLKKENDRLRNRLLAQQEALHEVFSMFINLGVIRGTNIVLQFSDDTDAETVYDDITKKVGDCLPNVKHEVQS